MNGPQRHEQLSETLIRVGFNPWEVDPEHNHAGRPLTTSLIGRMLCDPFIAAIKDKVIGERRARLGPHAGNIMGDDDPASAAYITRRMTATELKELHDRMLTWRINKETGLTEPPK